MGAGYLQGIALSMLAFGRSLFALRLLPAIGGSLAVPALYLLGRRLFGPRVALIAAILLATSHSHVHFSRTVAVSYTQGTFLVPLMLYFLLSGLETRSSLRMTAAAVILSIHFSIYVDSVIFIIYSLVFLMVARVVARPLMRRSGRQVAAFLVTGAIMLLPQTYYAASHPVEYLNRFYADGAVQSGWLADKVAETGQSAATILSGRVVHAFLSLFYYPAEDFYGTTKSMMHFMTTALFMMGLAYALWRTRDPHFLLVNGYLFAPAVAIGLTAIPPSADSYRMLTALPAAVLLAGVGLEELMRVLTLPGTAAAKGRIALSGLLLVAISILNLKTYFVDFAGRCRYGGDPQTRFASYLGEYLSLLDRSAEVFLLSDDVFQYGTHGSVDFLSGGLAVQNFPNRVDELRIAPGRVVIATPPRINELREWIEDNPGGTAVLEFDCTDPILMGYRLP
jgi:4-amino-4-deoxy-L-arabinose transferase-like glycosyltransferase